MAFSFYSFKSNESISFVWKFLKAECFVPGVVTPRVIIGDWAAELLISIP
jgi:hypothetical protein